MIQIGELILLTFAYSLLIVSVSAQELGLANTPCNEYAIAECQDFSKPLTECRNQWQQTPVYRGRRRINLCHYCGIRETWEGEVLKRIEGLCLVDHNNVTVPGCTVDYMAPPDIFLTSYETCRCNLPYCNDGTILKMPGAIGDVSKFPPRIIHKMQGNSAPPRTIMMMMMMGKVILGVSTTLSMTHIITRFSIQVI